MARKILLHTCCVSCLSYAYKKLTERGFRPVIFYYNPNIQGKVEFLNRLKDVQTFADERRLEVVVPEYNEMEYFSPIEPWLDKKSIKYINDKNRFRRKRCEFCYELRIRRTVLEAKKRKIKCFSSTLLTSPYQDHEFVDYVASQLAKEFKLEFVYEDFRKGFWQGRNFGRTHKYLIPAYCGCTFSVNERMLE